MHRGCGAFFSPGPRLPSSLHRYGVVYLAVLKCSPYLKFERFAQRYAPFQIDAFHDGAVAVCAHEYGISGFVLPARFEYEYVVKTRVKTFRQYSILEFACRAGILYRGKGKALRVFLFQVRGYSYNLHVVAYGGYVKVFVERLWSSESRSPRSPEVERFSYQIAQVDTGADD